MFWKKWFQKKEKEPEDNYDFLNYLKPGQLVEMLTKQTEEQVFKDKLKTVEQEQKIRCTNCLYFSDGKDYIMCNITRRQALKTSFRPFTYLGDACSCFNKFLGDKRRMEQAFKNKCIRCNYLGSTNYYITCNNPRRLSFYPTGICVEKISEYPFTQLCYNCTCTEYITNPRRGLSIEEEIFEEIMSSNKKEKEMDREVSIYDLIKAGLSNVENWEDKVDAAEKKLKENGKIMLSDIHRYCDKKPNCYREWVIKNLGGDPRKKEFIVPINISKYSASPYGKERINLSFVMDPEIYEFLKNHSVIKILPVN